MRGNHLSAPCIAFLFYPSPFFYLSTTLRV